MGNTLWGVVDIINPEYHTYERSVTQSPRTANSLKPQTESSKVSMPIDHRNGEQQIYRAFWNSSTNGFSLRSLFAASILRTPNSNRSDSDLRFPNRDRNQYMSLKHVQYCSPFQLELPLGCASRQKTLLQNKNAKRMRTHLKKSPALVLTRSVWKIYRYRPGL